MAIAVLLKFSHGLGDVVQASVILKHLRKYRKDWKVDIVVGRGKHTALIGLCHRVWHDQESRDGIKFDTEIDLGWWENYNRYRDRPNSKVTNCLHEVFGLEYDESLGRYECATTKDARRRAKVFLRRTGAHDIGNGSGKYNIVLIHYEGNTSQQKKNLGHWQVKSLCELAIRCGRVPVILDWDRRSTLVDQKTIFNPVCGDGDIWGSFGSGDAATIGAMVQLAEAFIGIDSGPGKIASALIRDESGEQRPETPVLICWRGHHPIQFHDPAPNTVHLIPEKHATMPPMR